MTDFKFRAAAALDLRRDQEQTAAIALARAEAALQAARALREAAVARREAAQDTAIAAARTGTDASTLVWHRNWIVGLSAAVERLGTDLDSRALAVREAERTWREARRRHLVLERLRDRAWRRHQQAEHRRELTAIDEVARLRYVMTGPGFRGEDP